MVSKPADRVSADRWLVHGADVLGFGRAYISNPNSSSSCAPALPLAPDATLTWYGGSEIDYLTYPT